MQAIHLSQIFRYLILPYRYACNLVLAYSSEGCQNLSSPTCGTIWQRILHHTRQHTDLGWAPHPHARTQILLRYVCHIPAYSQSTSHSLVLNDSPRKTLRGLVCSSNPLLSTYIENPCTTWTLLSHSVYSLAMQRHGGWFRLYCRDW